MSSDYEISDEDDYYDDEEMMDGTQDEVSGQSEDDEMDMDAYNDDFKVNTGRKRKTYEIDFESLSQLAVEKQMQNDVEHITGLLGVEGPTASLLLRQYSWNKERLTEKYLDNPSGVMVAAGASLPEAPSSPAPIRSHPASPQATPTRRSTRSITKLLSPTKSSQTTPKAKSSVPTKADDSTSATFECPICFDDSPGLYSLALACEHHACHGCWSMYVTSKVKDESEITMRCMQEGCGLVAPDPFIHDVLYTASPPAPELSAVEKEENVHTWSRFQELVLRHFVASNPNLKFCPYPGCSNTVSCPSASSKSSLTTIVPIVSCGARGIISDDATSPKSPTTQTQPTPAKPAPKPQIASLAGKLTRKNSAGPQVSVLAGKEHKFCFGCPIESDHRPVVCGVAKMWLKKCQDDSETANWIKSNTKECSQCQSTIEKNGGCNHMTCKKCKHEFCWVCMGPWSEHGTQWYSCNRYDEKAGVEARDAQSRSRASLERYLHYYNRWANHEQSAKLSLDLYAKTEKKMEDMQITSTLTWIEVQFMKKAVEEVLKCRDTLKWTYAMAYYLARGNQKDMFEDNQRDLEKAVEDLSELLEGVIEPDNIPTLRQKVTDKTVYVSKRNEIMLEDTAQGFLDGRWQWNVSVDGFDEPAVDARVD